MRETRQSGSEGGGGNASPYPYYSRTCHDRWPGHARHDERGQFPGLTRVSASTAAANIAFYVGHMLATVRETGTPDPACRSETAMIT
jgi:hypothetical protein